MADTGSTIFNRKARERLRTPDDLEKCIRVTHPSVWLVLAACLALLLGLLAWGVFGTVATTVSCQGTVVDGNVVCFLNGEQVSKVHEGDTAFMRGERMEVVSISETPLSKEEAKDVLKSDYLVSTLLESDWGYAVYFSGDGEYDFSEDVPVPMNITVERIAPISLVFG